MAPPHRDAQTSQLQSNINELLRKIDIENNKADRLLKRSKGHTLNGEHSTTLSKLAQKIANVYVQCGFATSDTDTLDVRPCLPVSAATWGRRGHGHCGCMLTLSAG